MARPNQTALAEAQVYILLIPLAAYQADYYGAPAKVFYLLLALYFLAATVLAYIANENRQWWQLVAVFFVNAAVINLLDELRDRGCERSKLEIMVNILVAIGLTLYHFKRIGEI